MHTKNVSETFDQSTDEDMLETHRKLNRNLISSYQDTSYWRTDLSSSICPPSPVENPIALTAIDVIDELFGHEASRLDF